MSHWATEPPPAALDGWSHVARRGAWEVWNATSRRVWVRRFDQFDPRIGIVSAGSRRILCASSRLPRLRGSSESVNSDPNNDQTVCELFDQIWTTGKLSYGSATLGLIIWPIMGIPINNEYKVVKEVFEQDENPTQKLPLSNYGSGTRTSFRFSSYTWNMWN